MMSVYAAVVSVTRAKGKYIKSEEFRLFLLLYRDLSTRKGYEVRSTEGYIFQSTRKGYEKRPTESYITTSTRQR